MNAILEHYTPPSSKISERICEMCTENASKYRCPRCEMATCSLPCTVKHKEIHGCSGQRNRAAFISRVSFDDASLSSDIAFLEDAARRTVLAKDRLRSVDPLVHKGVLVEEANRRQVDLRLLAEWFPKRKENRSYYRGRNMFWTIRWIIHLEEDQKPLELLIHGAKDQRTIGDIFQGLSVDRTLNVVQKEQLEGLLAGKKADAFSFTLLLDPAHRHQTGLTVALSASLTLRGCLARKLIVEYPTVSVRSNAPVPQTKPDFDIVLQDRTTRDDEDSRSAKCSQ
ncbi:putative Box C/D snoRNA protein 1 [Hypsibius exemplaris]|uniref:Box C/D snoRNA protein 1 n=1 Tax=Hypsibius exemplaris TaxID=2072580 RepID=A0A1W0XEU5_HYPEX|nr:putative Box C/D snoRNA protein 1 [Hypsibius exemplaris]